MKLKNKSALLIIITGLVAISLGLLLFSFVNTRISIESELKKDKENAIYISETIEKDLLELVRLTTTLASTNVIKESLTLSNNEFASFTVSERDAAIEDLNTTWMNTGDINDPFIKTRMENDVASFLVSQQEEFPDLYGEIFLTNEYGVMISTTGKLTTLAHYDKYWWQGAFDDGEGTVYLDDRGYDDSVDGYVLGIVVPIYDNEDNLIGILKSNYNIAYIFENSVSQFHNLNLEGEYFVVRTLGLIVDGNNIEPLSESISEGLLTYLEQRDILSKELNLEGVNKFVAIAPINLTFESDELEFGGSYESVDHSSGNLGEGWSVVYIIEKNIALSDLRMEYIYLGSVSVGLLFLVGITSLIIGQVLSKPFVKLNNYILEVGQGNLVKKDIDISGYEIENLKQSFDSMIDNLSVTLISKDKLEKSEARLQVSEKRYRELVDTIEAGIIVRNPDTSITMINEKAKKLLGLSDKALKGRKAVDHFWKYFRVNGKPLPLEEYPINLVISSRKQLRNKIIGVLMPKMDDLIWLSVSGTPVIDDNDTLKEVIISFFDVTNLKLQEIELAYQANNDFLTGLYNRRYYEDNLKLLDIKENLPITIAMADINGLKLINDAFGHDSGDELLIEAAKIISETCNKDNLVARIGGDEFVIVMPKTSGKEAEKIINKIHKKSKLVNIESIQLSISFGYKTKTINNENIQEVYRTAEDLMYREKLLEIPSMRSGAIETILSTLYEKDKNSEVHSRSVSLLSERIAKANDMSRQDIAEVKTAGLLHDIGKIIIPLSIINKDGKLTEQEYSTMKNHSEIGFRILNSTHEMRAISDIVLNHHERWDGKGYPRGIKKEKIPLKSRIIAIADAFDAMTSIRTYREIISKEEALQEIINSAGTQFDPELVKVFEKHFAEIIL